MTEIDSGKTLKIEANGVIKIEKLIKIEAGAVYNDGGNVTVNVYGKEPMKETSEGEQEVVQAREEAVRAEAEGAEVKLAVEDEERLLPVFKMDKEKLRQFFAEVQGAAPEQVTNKLTVWIADGRIAKKFNMNNLWEILNKMKIYPYNYKTLNKHVMR